MRIMVTRVMIADRTDGGGLSSSASSLQVDCEVPGLSLCPVSLLLEGVVLLIRLQKKNKKDTKGLHAPRLNSDLFAGGFFSRLSSCGWRLC